ncbi:alpha/beta hydrolase [Anaplasma platys]|nr:alpha/beta hydrolase [Anaplasma platys]
MREKRLLTLEDGSHLAYLKADFGSSVTVVFFCGFRSSMLATKASAIYDHCIANKTNCVVFDYLGHGDSSANFEDCCLSDWRKNCDVVIEQLTDTPLVVVGSSMGGWLALHAAADHPHRVLGLVTLAAAPDFTEDVESSMSTEDRVLLENDGKVELLVHDCSYLITKKLLKDGKNHLLLNRDIIPVKCPVVLIHGMQDVTVPYEHSITVAKKLQSSDVSVQLLKSGDHKLNEQPMLDRIQRIVHCVVAKAAKSIT